MKIVIAFYVAIIAFIFTCLWGWIGHIGWFLSHATDSLFNLVIGVVGAFIPFIGAMHYFLFL